MLCVCLCVCALGMTCAHIEQIKLKSSLINLPPLVSPAMTTTCNTQPHLPILNAGATAPLIY